MNARGVCLMHLVSGAGEILFFAFFPVTDTTTNDNIVSNNIEPTKYQNIF